MEISWHDKPDVAYKLRMSEMSFSRLDSFVLSENELAMFQEHIFLRFEMAGYNNPDFTTKTRQGLKYLNAFVRKHTNNKDRVFGVLRVLDKRPFLIFEEDKLFQIIGVDYLKVPEGLNYSHLYEFLCFKIILELHTKEMKDMTKTLNRETTKYSDMVHLLKQEGFEKYIY